MSDLKTDPKRSGSIWQRLTWFVVLWAAGVGAVALMAMVIKLALRHA